MFNKLAAAACLVSSAFAGAVNVDFDDYLNGKKQIDSNVFEQMWSAYENEFTSNMLFKNSESQRKMNFQSTVEDIIEHNSNSASSYKMGINEYADMTSDEFIKYFNIKNAGANAAQHCSATEQRMSVSDKTFGGKPTNWDWREHKGVSPVKNQGQCGSCWTFSTVGTLEAHMMIRYSGAFTPLSEQQLVDCAGAFDNHGCEGGLPSHAFEYVQNAGGISTEAAYPYFAVDHKCTVKSNTFALEVSGGSVNITEGDEDSLANAVYQYGPVSIAFQVVNDFMNYKSGVYSSKTCKNQSSDVNHAVVAVGYGHDQESNMDYWIVKNSWGASWGDAGFFKIERGVNMCGVAECNSFPSNVLKVNSFGEKHSLFLQN